MLSAKALKILVVEDDFLVSEEIVRVLRTLGHNDVAVASTGLNAVESVRKEDYDVIILDIQLPELDGFEAARRIQERRPTPIVILTAHETPDLLEKASAAGVGAYLTKPPDAASIERAMVIAIARHKDLMRLARLVEALSNKNQQLEHALVEIRTLRGIIPMCMFCKKIRDDAGFWSRVDEYIRNHTDAIVSHGLCPECSEREYKGQLRKR